MSKLARCLALVAAMAVVSATAVSVSEAQEKGKKTGKVTGTVEVNEGKDGKFRLIVRDTDDKYMATSAAYATKDDAMKGLDKLKAVLENPKITNKKATKNDKDKDKDKDKE
jgi:uncharacterized protein YegP (UPF0339 family)